MKIVELEHGENRHVKLKIHSCKQEDFYIIDAKYSLLRCGDEVPEEEGTCNIHDKVIDTVINPKRTGTYHLKITYYILDETLIDVIEVKVT